MANPVLRLPELLINAQSPDTIASVLCGGEKTTMSKQLTLAQDVLERLIDFIQHEGNMRLLEPQPRVEEGPARRQGWRSGNPCPADIRPASGAPDEDVQFRSATQTDAAPC